MFSFCSLGYSAISPFRSYIPSNRITLLNSKYRNTHFTRFVNLEALLGICRNLKDKMLLFEEKTFSSKFSLCADSTYLDISAGSFGFLVIKLRVDEIENYFEMFVAISQKSQKERTQRCIEWECRRNKILRKEMTRSTGKHLSKLGQDRHVFVTYHHSLTHPLT